VDVRTYLAPVTIPAIPAPMHTTRIRRGSSMLKLPSAKREFIIDDGSVYALFLALYKVAVTK